MTGTLILNDFDQLGIPAADAALAVAMYTKLEEHYPGHNWRTSADHKQGIASVHLQYLDRLGKNARYGVLIKIGRLNSDPDLRSVVKAGGELLERFGLRRDTYRVDIETKLRAVEHGLDLSR